VQRRKAGAEAGSELDLVLGALANPVRRAMLERLGRGEAMVSELAAATRLSLPAVSRHISTLVQAGLVEQERDGRRLWCRVRPEGLAAVVGWIDRFRASWKGQRQELDDALRRITGRDSG
jgi:DNA-binding transcriptional ArsR family regulator